MPKRRFPAPLAAGLVTTVVLVLAVFSARTLNIDALHGAIAPTLTARTSGPCPTFPQIDAPFPAVPAYPDAKNLRVQEFSEPQPDDPAHPEFPTGSFVELTRISVFQTSDSPATVREFYMSGLEKGGWYFDERYSSANIIYFDGVQDTTPWTNPPCNATVITGKPGVDVKIEITAQDGGGALIRIVEGGTPGL